MMFSMFTLIASFEFCFSRFGCENKGNFGFIFRLSASTWKVVCVSVLDDWDNFAWYATHCTPRSAILSSFTWICLERNCLLVNQFDELCFGLIPFVHFINRNWKATIPLWCTVIDRLHIPFMVQTKSKSQNDELGPKIMTKFNKSIYLMTGARCKL